MAGKRPINVAATEHPAGRGAARIRALAIVRAARIRPAKGIQLSDSDYRIDYDDVDVVDVVAQIRARSRRDSQASAELPEATEERARARLRAALSLDDELPFELQRSLRLSGTWNVTPDDLLASRRRRAGRLLSAFRKLARPGVKLLANFELPLYKQFKINLGVAHLLHELLIRNADLEANLDEHKRRIEALEARLRDLAPERR